MPSAGEIAGRASIAWRVARAYARLFGFVKDTTGLNLRGLGRLLRRVQEDRIVSVRGHQFFFDHRIAGAYLRMVAGDFNEPETHRLLEHVFEAVRGSFTFIDVGANVGEFLVTAAAHARVRHAFGFEPHPICAAACEASVRLNGLRNVSLIREVVGDGSVRPFMIDAQSANASGIGAAGVPTATTRLDGLAGLSDNVILLIDVEGAEPLVLKGAAGLIAAHQPLVIFEYNAVSKRSFSLADMRSELPAYEIFRLRIDGRLDHDVDNAWNCVGIPPAGPLRAACERLIVS